METLARHIQRIFNIRPEEWHRVVRVSVFALLPATGGAIGSPGIEALFFSRFGVEYLPVMYIALGLLTMGSTLLLTASLNRIPKSRLYRVLPAALAGMLVMARLVVSLDVAGFYPILWLAMYLFWTLQSLFIWGIAGMLFDARQAKRVFPIIAASGIAGNAIGGMLTGTIVTWTGTENLLLLWALSLALAFSLALRLMRGHDPPDIQYHRPKPTLRETLVSGGRTISRVPLMRWLSLATMLLSVLLFALAFPFSRAVAERFGSEAEMAAFLGIFQGLTTAVALLVSVAFAQRLFTRLGLMGSLVIFAAIYAAGFGLLAFVMSFTLLVGFRFAQQAWMMGIASTAHQASFNIIPPDHREPARMFVDGIPRQAGVIAGGLLLILFQPMIKPEIQFAGSAFIAAAAVLALWRARAAYVASVAGALRDGEVHIFQVDDDPMNDLSSDRHALGVLAAGMDDEDTSIRLAAVEILANIRNPVAKSHLLRGWSDPDAQVRAASLRALAVVYADDIQPDIFVSALEDPDYTVRTEASRYIPAGIARHPKYRRILRDLLVDSHAPVRAFSAARLLATGEDEQAEDVLDRMASSDAADMRELAMIAYRSWGHARVYDCAAQGLSDINAGVRREALRTIARLDPERCLDPIKLALGDSDQRVKEAAAEVLTMLGVSAVTATLSALHDPRLESGALLALEQQPIRGHENEIRTFIESKISSALEYETNRMELLEPEGSFSRVGLLAWSLQDRARRAAENAFRALGLITEPETVTLALNGLHSDSADTRASSLDLLERLDNTGLIRPALMLWDSGTPVSDLTAGGSVDSRRTEALDNVLQSKDGWLRACAVFAGKLDGHPGWRPSIERLASFDPDPLVRQTAAYVLAEEDRVNSTGTLPIMERVLFLRRVPLFSQLSPDELQQIASVAGEHIFYDGEVFVNEGELGDEMYIVVSGNVRVLQGSRPQVELAQRGPGEYVGEMSILTNEPRMASLKAEGDVKALCIEQGAFEHMLLEKPELGLSVMRALIHRLNEARDPGDQAHE